MVSRFVSITLVLAIASSCASKQETPTAPMTSSPTVPSHPVPTGPAFIPAASNDLVFDPRGIRATRYEHYADPQRGTYVQYDVSLLQAPAPGAVPPIPSTMRIHWDRGVPLLNHAYAVNAGEVFVEGLFSRDGLIPVVGGSVTYTAVGTKNGELLALDVDLRLQDKRALRATIAATLAIEHIAPQPP